MKQQMKENLEDKTSNAKLIQMAIWLSWFTVIYNILEGVVSIALGVSEGSMALAGFGGDSLIEVGSAFMVLWRFRGETAQGSELSKDRERKATLGIGVLFLLLAAITLLASVIQIATQSHPETTVPGVIIAGISISFMFYLWKAKMRIGHQLQSQTILKDAACSLACIKLSFVLFAGSIVFHFFPAFWWTDAAAALLLTIFIGKEGWEIVSAARKSDFSGGCGCPH
mgnify:CR=1 FL=1